MKTVEQEMRNTVASGGCVDATGEVNCTQLAVLTIWELDIPDDKEEEVFDTAVDVAQWWQKQSKFNQGGESRPTVKGVAK